MWLYVRQISRQGCVCNKNKMSARLWPTSEGNTKCVKCPEGTFSRNNSYEEKCVPDTDDCKSMPCVNNGTCTDLVDDFSCTCLEGFSGRRCEHGTNNCMP
ncbi:FAT4-like protein, partial [Mya arenaria]